MTLEDFIIPDLLGFEEVVTSVGSTWVFCRQRKFRFRSLRGWISQSPVLEADVQAPGSRCYLVQREGIWICLRYCKSDGKAGMAIGARPGLKRPIRSRNASTRALKAG